MKELIKSLGKVILASLVLLLALALIAGIIALSAKASFGMVLWRLFAGADGIVLLMIAVFLLTHRNQGKERFPVWKKHFPKLPFPAALLTVSIMLTAAACLVNYIVV